MKKESFHIGDTPAILLGEQSDKVFLFIHGQFGKKEEGVSFAKVVVPAGYQVLTIDLPGHGEHKGDINLLPWDVIPELKNVMTYIKQRWNHISIRANSIGAWFSMLSFADCALDQCLFVSPVVNMEELIVPSLHAHGFNEEKLAREKLIQAEDGQFFMWDYFCFVRDHFITKWTIPTHILYGERDEMVRLDTVKAFAKEQGCELTVMPEGEHWFHTFEQLRFLRTWEKKALAQ